MIIGTAGHIDHGKTALVRALTGIDTDRLPEEKRRGITIELGFAPLVLQGVGTVGVVDVPGHEAFVRTMVAGATGIDLALLVVAADEGVMPQTREHLAILSLLGTRGGVVALTKSDLVEPDWLELVRADVAVAVAGTPLEGAPIVATSALTGVGLDDLRVALTTAALSIPARDAEDVFRMPVDRVFSVRGTGTVVTGTVWSGTIAADQRVLLHPGGREVRVRGVQTHGRDVAAAGPASRAAIALAGVDVADVPRGAWVLGDLRWPATTVIRTEVALLSGEERPLRPREHVRLHLGATDVAARVVAARGPLQPGERSPARVVLQTPIIARAGDRFVLRRESPAATVGGGMVTDPLPPRRRARLWRESPSAPAQRLALLVQEAGASGIEVDTLYLRLGMRQRDVLALLREAGGVVQVGARLFGEKDVTGTMAAVQAAVDAHHARAPLDDGLTVADLRHRIPAAVELIDEALTRLSRASLVTLRGSNVSRAGWQPTLSGELLRLRDTVLADLRAGGAEPPNVSALTARYHSDVMRLVRMLERDGLVVAVEADRYYAIETLGALVGRLRDGMTRGREYAPAELRDLVGLSRKYLIPFLEYCDRQRITERRDGGRVFLGA
ncbi:MAG TPA: selenocysteine-specific translation elongation factor [Gemmatimonadaceae bacterium]|nr:selenocysteine-specific translation elongation factor [Gemmatimonadaceae bacterium]